MPPPVSAHQTGKLSIEFVIQRRKNERHGFALRPGTWRSTAPPWEHHRIDPLPTTPKEFPAKCSGFVYYFYNLDKRLKCSHVRNDLFATIKERKCRSIPASKLNI